MPSVNASRIDWPSESTEMRWPPTLCRARGSWGPITLERGEEGSGQGHSEKEAVTSVWEDQGRLRGGGGIWAGPGRLGFEPSPSTLAL